MLKKIYRKIKYKEKYSSKTYVDYLRKKGCSIGKNCRIFDPISNIIDIQNPYMITIGDNVKITSNVIILTHDYSWSVIANLKGEVLGGIGEVVIGDNVFIGMNSIILKNTHIGNNVIIGAGSVVTGKIEENSVYAGNPARKIMSIEDFYNRKKEKQLEEVVTIVKNMLTKKGRLPTKNELIEYFWIYTNKELSKEEKEMVSRIGNEEYIKKTFSDKEKQFNSYEELMEFCKNRIKERNG